MGGYVFGMIYRVTILFYFQSFADHHGCTDLHNTAHIYIESHFTEVLASEEFIGLQPNEVANLISSDTISVCSEEKIYEAALAWVQHDPHERGQYLPEVCTNYNG